MNMQHLQSLLIFTIVQIFYLSHHRTTASPVLSSDVVESGPDNNTTSYYEGYPQREELEKYSLYLLGHLKGSRVLSTINLALWNQHFDNEQEACEAVDHYLEPRVDTEPRGCEAIYKCDYDKYRFPATIVDVDCERTRSYCRTTQDNWPVRGSCLGDQYYLTTLLFIRDHAPLTPLSAQADGITGTGDSETSGDGDPGTQIITEDITGKWVFQTTLRNKSCLCLSK